MDTLNLTHVSFSRGLNPGSVVTVPPLSGPNLPVHLLALGSAFLPSSLPVGCTAEEGGCFCTFHQWSS